MDQSNTNFSLDFSSIIANSVHDIKNSLGMVITTLDELTEELKNCSNSADKLANLKYESKRINSQLIVLLTLYKFENKQYHLTITDHNVKDFIEEACLPYQELLDNKNVRLIINCSGDLVWFFDESLITGVIHNIINNAYRYTHDTIEITAEEKDNMLSITIADNGKGFPEKLLKSTHPTQKNISFQSGSTGLGLYFSGIIAKSHRNKGYSGYIQIDNKGPAQGGRFSLFLP